MNAKKAKVLRKIIYQDESLKQERRYKRFITGQIVAIGRRAEYQAGKKIN